MAEAQWYSAVNGQQQGPFGEQQFRAMIGRGEVRADTLVWSASLPGWTKAGDVPGLIPAAMRTPSAVPPVPLPGAPGQAAYPPVSYQQASQYPGGEPGAPMVTRAGPFGLLGRMLLVALCQLLIIPSPWANAAVYRWFTSTVDLPNGKRVVFNGRGGDIWYIFMAAALCGLIGAIHLVVQFLLIPLTALFYLMIVRWYFANLTWEGQRQPLQFTGAYIGFLGWSALMTISFLSIIGWAWVMTAQTRWICRHVEGSSQRLSFVGSGWGVLWRTFVLTITCIFIIPIPWMMCWFVRWWVSQLCLSPRS